MAVVTLLVSMSGTLAAAGAKHAAMATASKDSSPSAKPKSSSAFQIAEWASFNERVLEGLAAGLKLDLNIAAESEGVEEMTVYGKRQRRVEHGPADQNPGILLGPAVVIGTTNLEQAGFSGLKITAAIPISLIPGLDVVINVSGGHDQLNTSTTVTSAAATAGLRLTF